MRTTSTRHEPGLNIAQLLPCEKEGKGMMWKCRLLDYHRHFIFGSRKQKPLVSRGGLHDNHDIHCRVALQSAANCQVPTQHPGDSSTSAPPNVSSKHSVYSSQAQWEHNAMVLLVLTREGRIWSLMLCSQHQAPWSSVNSGKRVSKLCTKCQAFVFILRLAPKIQNWWKCSCIAKRCTFLILKISV